MFEWKFPRPCCRYACLLLSSSIFCCTSGFNFSSSFKEFNNFYSKNLKIRLHPRFYNKFSFEERKKRIESKPFSMILSCSVEMIYNLGDMVLSQTPNYKKQKEGPPMQFDDKITNAKKKTCFKLLPLQIFILWVNSNTGLCYLENLRSMTYRSIIFFSARKISACMSKSIIGAQM